MDLREICSVETCSTPAAYGRDNRDGRYYRIRGLLCIHCNAMVGHLEKKPHVTTDAINEYLSKPRVFR